MPAFFCCSMAVKWDRFRVNLRLFFDFFSSFLVREATLGLLGSPFANPQSPIRSFMVPRGSPGGPLGPKRLQKGVRFEAKIASTIELFSGVGKIGDPESPRVTKRALGTSRIKDILRRGCQIQLFAYFDRKAFFG